MEPQGPHGGVVLREVRDADLPIFFEQQLDAEAIFMAAFTAKDPSDRAAFSAHWAKIRANPEIAVEAIVADGELAGYIARFERFGLPEVSYWIGKPFWGRGIATAAVAQFLLKFPDRPLYARAAKDNRASIRVLEKCGFSCDGFDRAFADGRGEEVDEVIMKLDR